MAEQQGPRHEPVTQPPRQVSRARLHALGGAALAALGLSLTSTARRVQAATGGNLILGHSGNDSNPNLAENATEIRFDGATGPGVVFLSQADTKWAPSAAGFPAALGGWTSTNTNVPNGVYGSTQIANGTGVVGNAAGPSSTGVFGVGASFGVQGQALASNGIGVQGEAFASNGIAVQGTSFGSGGTAVGVQGTSSSGTGVQGQSTSSVGVLGQSNSGVAVEGSSNGNVGVLGVSNTSVGVYANSVSSTGLYATSGSGTGIVASTNNGNAIQGASNGNVGVLGTSNSSIGGFFSSSTSTGLFASGLNTGFAARFNGPVQVNGAFTVLGGPKSAAVPHPDGSYRRLYCMESPESWFGDFGRGQLANGRATVAMDRDFAALVHGADYYVFITPRGAAGTLYTTGHSATGFEVREQGGTSNVAFDYRVVAKRKDIAGPRLEKVDVPATPQQPAAPLAPPTIPAAPPLPDLPAPRPHPPHHP